MAIGGAWIGRRQRSRKIHADEDTHGGAAPDSGQLVFDEKPVAFNSPRDSRALGIEMIYQNLALAQNLDVVANVFLGREHMRTVIPGLLGWLDEARMEQNTRNLLDRLQEQLHRCGRM